MAFVFDATVGGVSANSYATVAYADDYHQANLNRSVWIESVLLQKQRALTMATRMLDQSIEWNGWKSTETQRLRHPRSGSYDLDGFYQPVNVVMRPVMEATCELAFWFLVSDRLADSETQEISSMKLDVLEMTFVDGLKTQVIPQVVLDMVKPFGHVKGVGNMVELYR